MKKATIKQRLEELRTEIRAERINRVTEIS